jgi:hypothetical protein
MKTRMIITAFTIGAAIQVMASDPSASTLKPELNQKMTVQFANPFAPTKTASSDKIERYGGMSSQPWSQIAAHHEDESSMYAGTFTPEPRLHLFWIGAEPRR